MNPWITHCVVEEYYFGWAPNRLQHFRFLKVPPRWTSNKEKLQIANTIPKWKGYYLGCLRHCTKIWLTFNDLGSSNCSICPSFVKLRIIVARQRSCIDKNSRFITPNDISVFAAVLHIIGYSGSDISLRPVNATPRLKFKISVFNSNQIIILQFNQKQTKNV